MHEGWFQIYLNKVQTKNNKSQMKPNISITVLSDEASAR